VDLARTGLAHPALHVIDQLHREDFARQVSGVQGVPEEHICCYSVLSKAPL